jgi:glutathione S-transferase
MALGLPNGRGRRLPVETSLPSGNQGKPIKKIRATFRTKGPKRIFLGRSKAMKLESMKMYDWDFAPNCRRVRMFLIEKGLEIERVECITPRIVLNDSYEARYPHYMVPMIELDDGTQIGEGLAIWTYLEALHPQPALMGTTALEKAAISAWERRAYDEGMVGHAEIFRNSHPNFVDRGLPGHREPVPQIPALIERGKLRVARFHKKFNEQLAQNKFVAGDKFSVADITTITVVDFGHALEMQIPDDCPHVKRWYDEMQQRDSVRGSLPTHLPDGSPMPLAA